MALTRTRGVAGVLATELAEALDGLHQAVSAQARDSHSAILMVSEWGRRCSG